MNLPPLTPEPMSAPHDPTRSPFNSPFYERIGLAGLALGVIAGLLVLIGAFGDQKLASTAFSTMRMEKSGVVIMGVISMALLIVCVALPWAWARFTGIGLLAASASVCFLIVIGARTDDRFLPFKDVTLHRAAWILYIAGLIFTVGLALALIGTPRIGRLPLVDMTDTSGYAVAGLVLSICGVFGGVTASLGIAFSIAGLDDIRRSEGTRTGRGMAIAGLVVGLVILVSVVAIAVIGSLTLEPSVDRND